MPEYKFHDFEAFRIEDMERQRRHEMEIRVANEPWRIPVPGGWRYLTKEQYVEYKLNGRVPAISASELQQIINGY